MTRTREPQDDRPTCELDHRIHTGYCGHHYQTTRHPDPERIGIGPTVVITAGPLRRAPWATDRRR